MSRKPLDTMEDVKKLGLIGAFHFAQPGAIEQEEAAGQAYLCEQEMLPREILDNTREDFENLGFVFGDDVDNLFVQATLPPGWKKEPIDHSMWSKIVDERGRPRVEIFYKAAFYDRHAHMRFSRRFSTTCSAYRTEEYKPGDPCTGLVLDADGSVVWHTSKNDFEALKDEEDYERKARLRDLARDWLNTNYPDWDNPLAYWEENNNGMS